MSEQRPNDQCDSNPHGTAYKTHCWHAEFHMGPAGQSRNQDRCCWCGKTKNLRIEHPKHGPHQPAGLAMKFT